MKFAYIILILSLVLFAASTTLYVVSFFRAMSFGPEDHFVLIASGAARIIRMEPFERTYIPLIYPPLFAGCLAGVVYWRIRRRSPKASGFPIH